MKLEEIVDRSSQQKLYVQIYSIIKGKIEKGEWPAGSQIPTEDEFCRIYEVSKATIRIAIAELVRDGYLSRRQGKGTFVTCSMPYAGLAIKTRLTEEMFGKGVKVHKEVIKKGVRELPEEIKSYLNVDGEKVYYILCKRVVDGEPACVEELFVPLFVLPGIKDEDISQASFFDLLREKSNRPISRIVQTLEVSEVGGDVARYLNMAEGSPALLMHRLFVGSDDTPMAYVRLMGNGSKYKIQTEFERIR